MTQDPIPSFEGHPVAATAVKITGKLITEDLQGIVLKHDDVVQVLTQYRVVNIHHDTDEKSGELIRVQIIRPIEMVLAPIDPSDPNDIGVLRALAQGSVVSNVPSPGDEDDD